MARQKIKLLKEMKFYLESKEALENGDPVRSLDFNEDQRYVNQAQLLTSKKMLYIANVGEDEIGDEDNDKVKRSRICVQKILKLSLLVQNRRRNRYIR